MTVWLGQQSYYCFACLMLWKHGRSPTAFRQTFQDCTCLWPSPLRKTLQVIGTNVPWNLEFELCYRWFAHAAFWQWCFLGSCWQRRVADWICALLWDILGCCCDKAIAYQNQQIILNWKWIAAIQKPALKERVLLVRWIQYSQSRREMIGQPNLPSGFGVERLPQVNDCPQIVAGEAVKTELHCSFFFILYIYIYIYVYKWKRFGQWIVCVMDSF